jgi:hypothetical protein
MAKKATINIVLEGRAQYDDVRVYTGIAGKVTTTVTDEAGKVISQTEEVKPSGSLLTSLCRDGIKKVFGFIPANGEYLNVTLTAGTRVRKRVK